MGSEIEVDVEVVLDAKLDLGEAPIWDPDRQRLVFVDIMRGHIHELDPATARDRIIDVGRPVSAVALTVRGDWVVAAHGGFYRVNPETGRTMLMTALEADMPENRMNDGYVDRTGRFWAGSMSMVKRRRAGTLYRLDPDGTATPHVTGVTTSNGLDWSLDGKLMYYVDTGVNRVDVFDFDETRGDLTGRRPFVHIGTVSGKPDGLIVDGAGFVWVALWKGGALHRYAPGGLLERVVKLPVSQVTKCAFGGPDLTDLYITTARVGLEASQLEQQPHAGSVFRVRPGVAGRPAVKFAS